MVPFSAFSPPSPQLPPLPDEVRGAEAPAGAAQAGGGAGVPAVHEPGPLQHRLGGGLQETVGPGSGLGWGLGVVGVWVGELGWGWGGQVGGGLGGCGGWVSKSL